MNATVSADQNSIDDPPQSVYFIGIALPPNLNRQIAELQWQLYHEKAHMIKPVLPHITLLHPPSLHGILPSQLLPRIHEVAERYLPMTIQLTGIDFFGKQVCFLEADALKLYSLQSQLVRMLPLEAQDLHYKRPYRPHITLAQVYDPTVLDRPALINQIDAAIQLPVTFTIDSVACFTRIKPRVYQPTTIE